MAKSKKVPEWDTIKNWDSKGTFSTGNALDSDRKYAGNISEIYFKHTKNRLLRTGNETRWLRRLVNIEKTDYKLLRYWSSSEEETESDESEGEPEEGALPTQLMGFASVKIDVSQTLFKKKETDHYHVDL